MDSSYTESAQFDSDLLQIGATDMPVENKELRGHSEGNWPLLLNWTEEFFASGAWLGTAMLS
jgi:hypothetical protein